MGSVSRKIRRAAQALQEAGGLAPVPQEYTPKAEGAPSKERFPLDAVPHRLRRAAVFKLRSSIASLACVRHPKREEAVASPE